MEQRVDVKQVAEMKRQKKETRAVHGVRPFSARSHPLVFDHGQTPMDGISGRRLPHHGAGECERMIFLDDEDRERFLDILGSVSARLAWGCYVYCLWVTTTIYKLSKRNRGHPLAGPVSIGNVTFSTIFLRSCS